LDNLERFAERSVDCPEFTFVFNGPCFSHWFYWIIWDDWANVRQIARNLPLFSMDLVSAIVFIGFLGPIYRSGTAVLEWT